MFKTLYIVFGLYLCPLWNPAKFLMVKIERGD